MIEPHVSTTAEIITAVVAAIGGLIAVSTPALLGWLAYMTRMSLQKQNTTEQAVVELHKQINSNRETDLKAATEAGQDRGIVIGRDHASVASAKLLEDARVDAAKVLENARIDASKFLENARAEAFKLLDDTRVEAAKLRELMRSQDGGSEASHSPTPASRTLPEGNP
jgi:hypothetical protein